MAQSVQLFHIRLEPAPGPHEPGANAAYDFVAPLDTRGMIDVDAWRRDRALCFVHRIESSDNVQHGLLVHRPGGPNGATWRFDYELGEGDEETGFRFEAHAFTVGAYVSVRDADDQIRTYRVASVTPA
ncbi:MAG: hypothetical protein JWO64_2233 [Hyphomicrobiales bacterium]|jgi:hypothetical protein|nr:hypothetical protein [Hyphomicrobiales bacterium]